MSLADREFHRLHRNDLPPPSPQKPSKIWFWIVVGILLLVAARFFWPPS